MVPPEVYYFGDRRGWYVSLAWLTDEWVERLRAQGAAYLVVSGDSVSAFAARRRDLYEQYASEYRTLLDDERGIIFDLSRRARSAALTTTP
jgi:hypothetical protein